MVTDDYNIFVRTLRKIAGVSEQYAAAAWFSLVQSQKDTPVEAATEYKNRFSL